MNNKAIIYLILSIIWMSIIFSFSSQDSDESTYQSNGVGYFLAKTFVPDFDTLSQAEQTAYVESIDYPIRKCAHATEYSILGFLIFGCMSNFFKKSIKIVYLSVAISALYATSDEIHQLFVPGRSCQITDVLIDTAGALVGILFHIIVSYLITRYISRSSQDNA